MSNRAIVLEQFRKEVMTQLLNRGWEEVEDDAPGDQEVWLAHPEHGVILKESILYVKGVDFSNPEAAAEYRQALEAEATIRLQDMIRREQEAEPWKLSEALRAQMVTTPPHPLRAEPVDYVPLPKLTEAVIVLAERYEALIENLGPPAFRRLIEREANDGGQDGERDRTRGG